MKFEVVKEYCRTGNVNQTPVASPNSFSPLCFSLNSHVLHPEEGEEFSYKSQLNISQIRASNNNMGPVANKGLKTHLGWLNFPRSETDK